MKPLHAELWFMGRDRATMFWLSLAALITATSIVVGIFEIESQRSTIAQLTRADAEERRSVLETKKGWGSLAYYTFHLTYDEPSRLAFAALGQRDNAPWKHRIRMLALEGQIYEADGNNAVFALTGGFDFAFVASILLPLFVIFLLYGLRADERTAGRFELLSATASSAHALWFMRAALRMAGLAICLLAPFVIGSLQQGAETMPLAAACIAVLLHILFWWLITELIGRRMVSGALTLTLLIGMRLCLTVLIPAAIKLSVEQLIEVPEGADILLAQREAVNDAWDLPKEATMAPFLERHPQWRDYAKISKPFEWKWYFAFQQVGDQTVQTLSEQYRRGRCQRDHWAGWLSLLSPPTHLDRTLQMLARTDVEGSLAYERSVRAFHANLRAFFYPLLFEGRPFEASTLREMPSFAPQTGPSNRNNCSLTDS
ncbi:MAG: DUF3526 domain-containing protein [Myxococcota bacterium]